MRGWWRSVLAGATVVALAAPAARVNAPGAAAAPTVAGPELTVLVSATPGTAGTSTVARAAQARGARVAAAWPEIGVVSLTVPQDRAGSLVTFLRAVRGVAAAGVSGRVLPDGARVPRSRTVPVPTNERPGAIAQDVRSVAANRQATGRGVSVGVADTGVLDEHSELTGQVDLSRSGTCTAGGSYRAGADRWRPAAGQGWALHGTSVASVIAARRDGHGMRGIAPEARLVVLRVVDDEGNIYPEASICATMAATRLHLPVLNHSYGIDSARSLRLGHFFDPADVDDAAVIQAVTRALAWSRAHGVLDVAALGNAGEDASDKPHIPLPASERVPVPARARALPGELPGVLGVSQANADGTIGFESTFGLGIADLSAVGEDELAAHNGTLAGTSGTSFSSPAVAATAALVTQLRPQASPAQIEQILYAGARKATCAHAGLPASEMPRRAKSGLTSYFGHGHADALNAVTLAAKR